MILAKTVKGWTLGPGIEARNVTHQAKKLTADELKIFRDRLELDIPDDKLKDAPYFHPGKDAPEIQYMLDRRRQLGGSLPRRVVRPTPLTAPKDTAFSELFAGSDRPASTTMAFSRLIRNLVRDKEIGRRVVPIIPDEARTFGMDPLFKEVGIYNPLGQRYTPVDKELLLSYLEKTDGQVLEEGITEAGAISDFTAAGTAYATWGEPMIPFYIFYSMFGFQRTGDQAWAFGDARGRGFMMGATAGRTTLTGEGLQHDDGHSHVLASTIPNIRAYDPAVAYELAIIVRDGIERMVEANEDVFYYITLYNENWPMPAKPEGDRGGRASAGCTAICAAEGGPRRVQLLGSGPILHQAVTAQQHPARAVRRGRRRVERDELPAAASRRAGGRALEPPAPRRRAARAVRDRGAARVGRTDRRGHRLHEGGARTWSSRWIERPYTILGTDGFGRSDTREALRIHFEVSPQQIAYGALHGLCRNGQGSPEELRNALGTPGDRPGARRPRRRLRRDAELTGAQPPVSRSRPHATQ